MKDTEVAVITHLAGPGARKPLPPRKSFWGKIRAANEEWLRGASRVTDHICRFRLQFDSRRAGILLRMTGHGEPTRRCSMRNAILSGFRTVGVLAAGLLGAAAPAQAPLPAPQVSYPIKSQ